MQNTKCCSTCKEEKTLSEFSKDVSRKDKRQRHCKKCVKKYSKDNKTQIKNYKEQYYQINKEKIKIYSKLRNQNNIEKVSIQRKQYRAKNSEICKYRARKYKKDNPHIINAINAKRRASKLKATPKWLTKDQLAEIADIYKQAKELEAIFFNRKFEVDHIIPLKGKNVCGLHVPWNLQILTAEENLSKGNKLPHV